MIEPRLQHVDCPEAEGSHRMAYWDWQPESAAVGVVICVHGLTRQGRDFDQLARELVKTHRVICPDVVGRGESDWLKDPSGYQVPTYAGDMIVLMKQLQLDAVTWVGTSMGGLIGMVLASLPQTPIRRLVLNDVGPAIEADAVRRIAEYVGTRMEYDSVEAAAAYLRSISASFGPHSDDDWLALTRPQLRALADGRVRSHYDPAISVPLKAMKKEDAQAGEAMLWQCYEAIQAPILLVRGAESDLLSPATAQRMTELGPKARLAEVAGVGHAPTLVAADQVKLVADFVRGTT